MAERRIPQAQPTKRVVPQAQISIDPSAPASQAIGLFANLASVAGQSADRATALAAEAKAESDLASHPEGVVPSKRRGTSIAATIYNQTAESLYSIKNDSEMLQHMGMLEREFEGNPAGYQEASTAYMDSRLKGVAEFDVGFATKTKMKYDLMQQATIPKLQDQANIKLSKEQVDTLELQGLQIIQNIEDLSAGLADPNRSEAVVPLLGTFIADRAAAMAGAIDPATQERRFSDADVLNEVKGLWEKATYDGLRFQMEKLSDEELASWQTNLRDDTFETLFFTPENGTLSVPLSDILPAQTRRQLLSQTGVKLSQRGAVENKSTFEQALALERFLDDSVAQARARDIKQLTSQEAEGLGMTAKQFNSYDKAFKEAEGTRMAEGFVFTAQTGEPEANVAALDELLAKGEADPSQATLAKEKISSANAAKIQALHGVGNGMQYVVENSPEMAEQENQFWAGEVSANVFGNNVRNYNIQQGVPEARIDYISDFRMGEIRKSISSASDFIADDKATTGGYGEALTIEYDNFAAQFGDFTDAAMRQAIEAKAIPSDMQGFHYLANAHPESRANFSRMLDSKLALDERFTAGQETQIKENVQLGVSDSMRQSVPLNQTGKFQLINQLEKNTALMARFYQANGDDEGTALARAEEDFYGDLTFISSPNGGKLRLPKSSGIDVRDFRQGVNFLSQAIIGVPLVSTDTVMEGQTVEEVDAVFNERMLRGGQWFSDGDDRFVVLHEPNGTPVDFMGVDGKKHRFKMPIETVAEIGNTSIPRPLTVGTSAPILPSSQAQTNFAAKREESRALLNDYLASVGGSLDE